MILDVPRAARLSALAAALAVPASAQYTRSGSLNWRWDDYVVNSGAGRFHDAEWAQLYNLALRGPLVNPAIGSMRTSFAFSDGASGSQAATTGIPHQQQLSYDFMTDFFRPEIQRYIRLSPNFSRTDLKQSGTTTNGAYSTESTTTGWGLSTGLSLPRLPSFNYSRQVNTLNAPSNLNPAETRSTTESKNASYGLFGHLTLNASEQTSNIADMLRGGSQNYDFRKAGMEANFYEPKRVPLQSFYFRSDIVQNESNGIVTQKQGTSNLSLTTHRYQTGRWQSSLFYGANGSRQFDRNVDSFGQNATLNSTRPVRAGSLGSAFAVGESPTTPSQSIGESLSLRQRLFRGNVSSDLSASGTWSRSPALTLLSDGLNGRWDLFPDRSRVYFAEARSTGSEALRGSGGGRTNRAGLGLNSRSKALNLSARADHTESRVYASHTLSVSDQFSFEMSGRPFEKLFASSGYNLGIVRYPTGGSHLSHNLRGSLDYNPITGLNLAAAAVYAGTTGYTANASATYTLGNTSLKVLYEYQELSTPMTFSHVGVTLSRFF